MTKITLVTKIYAPIQKVFDLSRDIDFHTESASQTKEYESKGITSGLIGLGENVTWKGKHFGVWLSHTSTISASCAPLYFVDEMTKGMFKYFKHEHHFEQQRDATLMTDILYYETPYGIFGKLTDVFLLKKIPASLFNNT